MLKSLRFAFVYALRNMWRDRQRTAFALFSIAAGVATVVALRALGLMITDALTSNVQGYLRGDLRVDYSASGFRISGFGNASADSPFTSDMIGQIEAWARRNEAQVTFAYNNELMQAAVVKEGRAGRPAFVIGTFIDPKVYPFYDIIRAEAPPGALLGELFDGSRQVVLGRRAADQLGAQPGDQIRVGAAKDLYTVKGIVPDSAESSFENPSALMFSFVYIDRALQGEFGITPGTASRAYVKLPPTLSPAEGKQRVIEEWPEPRTRRIWRVRTTDDVLRTNEITADVLSRFVLLMSVIGLVIGGVGIINTMLVAVNRRSSEIAVLKTLGLKANQVSLIFLVEAIISGFLGSLLGIVLGMFLSFIARDFGQQAFAIPLPWRLYLDPMLIGIGLGVAITVFFSFLPTLMAGQVRPNLVLRSGTIPLARAGCLPSLLSLAALIIGIGVLVDLIIGTSRFRGLRTPLGISPGILGTLVVFILLGISLGLTWIVVWLLGKLPSFRNADVRLAIRGLTLHRNRTALSLLALMIGMSSLSGTLILTRSITTLLYTSISEPLGGNVIVLPILPLTDAIHGQLDKTPGVNGYRDVRFTGGARLAAIDGNRDIRFDLTGTDDARMEFAVAQMELIIGVRVYGDPPRGKLVAGRYLTPEDNGKDVIVLPQLPELAPYGIRVGSRITYRFSSGRSSQERTFEVVGLVAPDSRTGAIPFSLGDSAPQVPIGSVTGAMPFDFVIADVKPEAVNDALAAVGTIPGIFVFDVGIFDSILTRLFNQLAALPLLVAILSLFAAGALIATTVSLATLERRRQIGILKAIGVKRRQALAQLLIENGIVGLAGGIISLLPTMLILGLVPALTQGLVALPVPWDLIGLMVLVALGVTLFATLLTAWSASSEKPLQVLRYE